MRVKATTVLLALVGSLLVAELVLRLAGLPAASFEFLNPEPDMPEVFVRDPALFWRLRPDGVLYRVNEHGTRGHWPLGPKRPGEVRIACVGDSSVLGVGVRYEDTFGLLLERELRARRPELDVTSVLAANTGYSTYQSRVLCESLMPELAPDWTILYCGAWNDYVAAIGAADAERAAEVRGADTLRLVQVVRRALFARRKRSTDYRAAMEAGRYPDGPRVSLAAFRENLRALVAGARTSGRVLLVVPPLPEETERLYPIAREYGAAVAAVAREAGAACVDGPALFRETLAGVPEEWRTDASGRPLLFIDWIHPSAFGHRVLAGALLALVSPDPLPAAVESWRISVEGLAPADSARIDWLPPTELVVRGQGFLGPDGPVLRAWLGEHWIEGLEVVDDATLRLSTRMALRSGLLGLALVTPRGTLATGIGVEVAGPAVEAELGLTAGGWSLRARIRGQAGDGAALWASDALRAAPLETPYGTLWIVTQGDGRPPDRTDLPFRFDRAQPVFAGALGEDGVFAIELALPASATERTLHVQGGLLRGDVGALSSVVHLSVSPDPR